MVLSLLWRYLSMYWLKPFDAVNDTANAWSLRQFPWEPPILEIGGGDGVFSFIMHGGAFEFRHDRYGQTDLSRGGDIYDVYRSGSSPALKRRPSIEYLVGLGHKTSHLLKSRETKLYAHLVSCHPGDVPLKDDKFKTTFLYLSHALTDYGATLREIRQILRDDGALLMIAVNGKVRKYFTCSRLALAFEKKGFRRLGAYFSRLDGGRCQEIVGLSMDLGEWRSLLHATGFELVEVFAQVSPFAWRVYDLQTRPILWLLIRFSSACERWAARTMLKAAVVLVSLPVLWAFYHVAARPRRISIDAQPSEALFAFRAVPR